MRRTRPRRRSKLFRSGRFSACAAFALAVLVRPVFAEGVMTTVAAPHPPRPGETPLLEVTLGHVARGQEVEITTPDGRLLGTVSPFGIRPGRAAGTYLVPLPADAIHGEKVAVRLQITQPNGPARAPTADEVV